MYLFLNYTLRKKIKYKEFCGGCGIFVLDTCLFGMISSESCLVMGLNRGEWW